MAVPTILGGTNARGKVYVDGDTGGVIRSTYDYRVEGLVRIDECDRLVLCRKENAVAVAEDLVENYADPLVVYVGDADSVSHGNGWTIFDAQGANFSPSLQTFAIKYKREVPAVWDWMLPASVTLACAGSSPPTTVISFDGNPAITYETPGYPCLEVPLRFTGEWITETLFRLTLLCNGYPVETWEVPFVTGGVSPEFVLSHRLHWESSGVAYARLVLSTTTILDFVA